MGMVFIHSGAAQPAAGADRAIALACGGGRACGWGIERRFLAWAARRLSRQSLARHLVEKVRVGEPEAEGWSGEPEAGYGIGGEIQVGGSRREIR